MDYQFSKETITLIIVMITSFLTPFTASAITLALPGIGIEFHDGALLLSWVVAAFLLSTAAFLLPFGRMSDIIGRKKVFVLGVYLFTISSLLSGLAWSIPTLIFFRMLQGLASAMIFSTGMAIVTLIYPATKRGKAIGLIAAAVYIGLSLGPVLGGLLNYHIGWRSIFYFTTFLSGFTALLTAWCLKGEWVSRQGETFDTIGNFSYVFAVLFTLYGLSEIARVPWAKYCLCLGFCLLIIFLYYESKQEFPLFPIRMCLNNRVFAYSNLAAMINYSATFAISFLLSLYLQVIMGYDSQIAGIALLAQPLIMAIVSPFAGSLSDRISPSILSCSGMTLSILGLACFIFITPQTSLVMIIASQMLLGLGFAIFGSPNNNSIMGSVEKKFYGVAASALGTMRLLGQAISMAIVTLVLSGVAVSPDSGIVYTEELAKEFHLAFIIFTVICGLGIFPAAIRNREKNMDNIPMS